VVAIPELRISIRKRLSAISASILFASNVEMIGMDILSRVKKQWIKNSRDGLPEI